MQMPSELQRNPAVQELVSLFDSSFFAALSEPVRVEILKLLIVCGRADIATISLYLPQDRSVISRHLKLMEEAGILVREKEGRHGDLSANMEWLGSTRGGPSCRLVVS